MKRFIFAIAAALCAPARAALKELRVSMTSTFIAGGNRSAPADSLAKRFEDAAVAQRLRDDVVSGVGATPLGGWTVEVVRKSSEYEKSVVVAGDEDGAAVAGDADVEVSEARAVYLGLRVARVVSRRSDRITAWREITGDFPAYRGALAGPAPKNFTLDGWRPGVSAGLWVAGVDIPLDRKAAAHALVRDAMAAADAHINAVTDRARRGLSSSAPASAPPTRLGGLDALDAGDADAFVLYDSRADEDADFEIEDTVVDARFVADFEDPDQLRILRDALDVYTDPDIAQTSIPVVIRVHATDDKCAAALGALGRIAGGGSRAFAARRRFLDALWRSPRAPLDDGRVRAAFTASLDAKARSRAATLYEEIIGVDVAAPLDALGLSGVPTPLLFANGRLALLAGEKIDRDGVRRFVGRHVEDAKYAKGGIPAPFYSPSLTPSVSPAAEDRAQVLFSAAFPAEAPPPLDGWTLYGDGSDASAAWEAALGSVAETLHVRPAPAPAAPRKKRKSAAPSAPFLVCADVVTALALPAIPATATRAQLDALVDCGRALPAETARPFWERALRAAPPRLVHASTRPDAPFEVLCVADPLGPYAPVLARLLEAMADDLGANVTLALNPVGGSDLETWSRTSVFGEPVAFSALTTKGRVRLETRVPEAWRLRRVDAGGFDADALAPAEFEGGAALGADFSLDAVFLRGPTAKKAVRRNTGFGVQFGQDRPCVAVNGEEVLVANGEFVAPVTDFSRPIVLGTRESVKHSLAPRVLAYRKQYLTNCTRGAIDDDGTIHVFSVASGATYERLLRIMMGSAVLHSSSRIHFWVLGDFLSPAFDAEGLAAALGCEITLLDSPPWPQYLIDYDGERIGIRGDKQRLIWAYKILFLDTLFYGKTDRVIFVDADSVVRGDLAELWKADLDGAPYAFVPFCHGDDANAATAGHRFWEAGFWGTHLGNTTKYHISALFVVDVPRFRFFGDGLRTAYKGLAPDPNSLANLDQDLPNYLQKSGIPIAALPQDWLYCEAWCDSDRAKTAKAIDMCQNPLTKEHKLDMARRIADPLWSKLDAYMATVADGTSVPFAGELAGARADL